MSVHLTENSNTLIITNALDNDFKDDQTLIRDAFAVKKFGALLGDAIQRAIKPNQDESLAAYDQVRAKKKPSSYRDAAARGTANSTHSGSIGKANQHQPQPRSQSTTALVPGKGQADRDPSTSSMSVRKLPESTGGTAQRKQNKSSTPSEQPPPPNPDKSEPPEQHRGCDVDSEKTRSSTT
ncbi:hypothetical protein MY3296_010158 [Beauveria thailandica]